MLKNIKGTISSNDAYRRVLFTTEDTQFVAMYLEPGQEIGLEQHEDVTQAFLVQKGSCMAKVGQTRYNLTKEPLKKGSLLVVPRGVWHNVVADEGGCWLLTVYSPPEHKDGLVQMTK